MSQPLRGRKKDTNVYCEPVVCWNRRGGTLASWYTETSLCIWNPPQKTNVHASHAVCIHAPPPPWWLVLDEEADFLSYLTGPNQTLCWKCSISRWIRAVSHPRSVLKLTHTHTVPHTVPVTQGAQVLVIYSFVDTYCEGREGQLWVVQTSTWAALLRMNIIVQTTKGDRHRRKSEHAVGRIF